MKRFICILISVLFACSAFAQLTKVQSAYKSVYKWNGITQKGEIRYDDEFYYLCGESSNKYEETMHTIVLGDSKESSIVSLQQLGFLRQYLRKGDEIKVIGMGGKTTSIFKSMGNIFFSTKGVAGMSGCLNYFKVDDAIQAITKFNPLKQNANSDVEHYLVTWDSVANMYKTQIISNGILETNPKANEPNNKTNETTEFDVHYERTTNTLREGVNLRAR